MEEVKWSEWYTGKYPEVGDYIQIVYTELDSDDEMTHEGLVIKVEKSGHVHTVPHPPGNQFQEFYFIRWRKRIIGNLEEKKNERELPKSITDLLNVKEKEDA